MCAPLGYKCGVGGTCVPAFPTIGCEAFGPSGCRNCNVGLMATAGDMSKNAAGEWEAPAGAMHGRSIPGLGWVLTDAGKSGLQPGDIVLTIGAKDDEVYPANAAWFALHWFETQQPKPPSEYVVTYYRPGERQVETVTLTRV